jgi:peptide/nickel transport system substrate-binding protein
MSRKNRSVASLMIGRRELLAGAAVATVAGQIPARAATPDNTLVIAKNIGDIISLDPAEVYEASGGEVMTNVYDRLIRFEADDLTKLVGGVAADWVVSSDAKTFTFHMRPGLKFQSGGPVTADDVAFSLQRVVLLDKTPAFLLNQFGWTRDNVRDFVKAADPNTLQLTVPKQLAPTLVLNVISSTIGSVVEKRVALSHETNGDLGYGWLRSNAAASGAFSLREWKPDEIVALDANPGFHLGPPKLKRVVIQHVADPAAQFLLLRNGDVDMARDLTADQVNSLANDINIAVDSKPSVDTYYVALNQSAPQLADPKVRQALRYLIDYAGMANSFLKGQFVVHETFLPDGIWSAIDSNPFALDVAKAKSLLAESGYPNGFEITLDAFSTAPWTNIAQSIQATMAQAGIRVSILAGEEKQVWTRYRARQHQMLLIEWSPDYLDPHSNAETFARNTDNSYSSKARTVAWRNNWSDLKLSAQVDAAVAERDAAKRQAIYEELQKEVLADGPYLIMFQPVVQVARRKQVQNFIFGPYWDLVFYREVVK